VSVGWFDSVFKFLSKRMLSIFFVRILLLGLLLLLSIRERNRRMRMRLRLDLILKRLFKRMTIMRRLLITELLLLSISQVNIWIGMVERMDSFLDGGNNRVPVSGSFIVILSVRVKQARDDFAGGLGSFFRGRRTREATLTPTQLTFAWKGVHRREWGERRACIHWRC